MPGNSNFLTKQFISEKFVDEERSSFYPR